MGNSFWGTEGGMDPMKLSLRTMIFYMHVISWADNGCYQYQHSLFPALIGFLGIRDNAGSL